MKARRTPWLALAGLAMALGAAGGLLAGEPALDLEDWHESGPGEDGQGSGGGWHLGLYPGLSAVLGAPNVVSYQASGYLSLGDGRSFSLFLGYGEEHGPRADAEAFTIGWGGVRPLPSAAPQNGFHGKFLRYRRWEHSEHGIHHGLSVGTEVGVGFLALELEAGAARSDRNHWMATAQVGLKLALPVFIPLGAPR